MLEGAVAGTPLLRLEAEDDLQELKATVMQDLEQVMSQLSTSGKGVHVQVSSCEDTYMAVQVMSPHPTSGKAVHVQVS